jgi:Fe-S-cluster containining protein
MFLSRRKRKKKMPRTPEEIAEEARNAISPFCVEECKAYCCRKGYLVITKEEVDIMCGRRMEELTQKKSLKLLPDGKYSLFLGNPGGCPSLKDNKCMIHKNPKRPDTCKAFPIFIEGDTVNLSQRCLAVKQEKLYPYVAEMLKAGYKIVEMEEKKTT